MNATKDLDPAAATAELEHEVREFLRREMSTRERPQTATAGDTAAEDVNSLLQRVAVCSTDEVERIICELQAVQDALRTEADRVQRAAADHADTSQAAFASIRVFADGLQQLKTPTPHSR